SYIHRTNTKIKVDFQPSRIQVESSFYIFSVPAIPFFLQKSRTSKALFTKIPYRQSTFYKISVPRRGFYIFSVPRVRQSILGKDNLEKAF
ncbi:hypothetical protein P4474_14630, partial [Geobacillus stearothermophilus]|uniref:hypothetical protein n=1 Tax=Geobacillus stearothermophilus TaxID=1422 RepID=UPI002E239ACA|nr:hypothetical protein [Geobacillus stearothermophilus]